jgi:4,5-DOPA dioxygenase extradiol
MLPSLFISHGAPTVLIDGSPAHHFLKGLGDTLGRPSAVVVASAHWEAPEARVTAAPWPETIHDFGGFAAALHRHRYPAPGEARLAAEIVEMLGDAGIASSLDPERGLDHGAWVPLSLLFPAADIPVVQVAIDPHAGPAWHARLGAALRPLRDRGVLVLASGSLTHNLHEVRWGAPDVPPPDWVMAFGEWMAEALTAGRTEDLLDYRRRAPHATRNHPTDEHLLPLFVAMGAARDGGGCRRLHSSHSFGVVAMDAYAFD